MGSATAKLLAIKRVIDVVSELDDDALPVFARLMAWTSVEDIGPPPSHARAREAQPKRGNGADPERAAHLRGSQGEAARRAEIRLMEAIAANPEAGAARLGELTGSKSTTTSERLKRLERRGQVARDGAGWKVGTEARPQ